MCVCVCVGGGGDKGIAGWGGREGGGGCLPLLLLFTLSFSNPDRGIGSYM